MKRNLILISVFFVLLCMGVTAENPFQELYNEASPSVVRVVLYADFDFYAPSIEYVDFTYYNQILWGGWISYY